MGHPDVETRSGPPAGRTDTTKLEGESISNVYVLVRRNWVTDIRARTDEKGKYAIQLPPGIYDVLISARLVFAPVCRKVEIEPDSMMTFSRLDLGCQNHLAFRSCRPIHVRLGV